MATMTEQLGWRARRRPATTLGTVVGAAGGVLAATGVTIIGGDQAGDGGDGTVGALLAAILVVAGIIAVLRGPLAAQTAGVTASAAGVGIFCLFAFFVDSPSTSHIKTAMVVSALLWLALYFYGPTRGHTVFLGAAVLVIWIWLLVQIGADLEHVQSEGGAKRVLDKIAGGSMVLGGIYLVIAAALDRRRFHGSGTALFTGAVVALLGGAGAFTNRSNELSGVLLMGAGAALVLFAVLGGRRGSAWFGAAGIAGGFVVLLNDVIDDEAVLAGILVIAAGIVVAVAAHYLATRANEPVTEDGLAALGASVVIETTEIVVEETRRDDIPPV